MALEIHTLAGSDVKQPAERLRSPRLIIQHVKSVELGRENMARRLGIDAVHLERARYSETVSGMLERLDNIVNSYETATDTEDARHA